MGKSSSWNCCATVQGMRSPDARLPLDKPSTMEFFDTSPSKHTWLRETCPVTRNCSPESVTKSFNFLYKPHQYRIRKGEWSVLTPAKHYDREDYKAQWINSKEQGSSWEANMYTGRHKHIPCLIYFLSLLQRGLITPGH